MPKQSININFSQGLDTKTDEWQLPIGKFEVLENSIFQKGGLLQKRNGYGNLTSLSDLSDNTVQLTTLNDNLISVGKTISAYSSSLNQWVTKGSLKICPVSVLPLIRNNINQSQCDSVVSNGLVLTTYTQTYETNSSIITQYLYAIADVVTGQSIVSPTLITPLVTGAISGSSRVFLVGNYFVIVSQVTVAASTYLQYISIPTMNPVSVDNIPNSSLPQNINADTYTPISSNPGWDGIVTNNTLVVAYNTLVGGQGVHVTSLTIQQIAENMASGVIFAYTNAAYIAGIVSICTDLTSIPNFIYISFWNPNTSNAYTASVFLGFGTINNNFNPVIITNAALSNLASSAKNNFCTIFSEVINNYSYDSSIPSHLVHGIEIDSFGILGAEYTVIKSVGIASKSFIIDDVIYFLSAFQSPFQPSYFLINGSSSQSAVPVVVSKLAYQNGGGYVATGLPSVTIDSNVAQISYLFKDDVEALNTLNNTQQTTAGGIYSQTGINLASFTIGTNTIDTSEIANSLHISGGYLSMFDGYLPVEHNFFLFPDSVECTFTAVSTVTPTGTTATGSKVITAVSSVAGVSPGMTITGGGIPANSIVVLVGVTTITINQSATANHVGEVLTIQGNIHAVPDGGIANTVNYYYQATYEWTDNNGLAYRSSPSIPVPVTTTGNGTAATITINVPMLRLTAKVANPVKIVIYRWSTHTQVYNQVTSIIAPLLNDTRFDSISFVDTLPDDDVVGNNLIYTTGGVVPNVNGPSSNIITLFDTRLWMVTSEDPNTFFISKTIIKGVPVEMSSEFIIYVAPNIGTTESSGPMTAAAPMDDKMIIFKKNSIFYINGTGPDNLGTTSPGCPLGNYSQPIFITSTVGCVNQKSIVLMRDGLMFQSDKGIWILKRDLATEYIGAPVERFNSSQVTSAHIIPQTNRVLFTLDTGGMLMFDYYYEQWGTFSEFSATSSCIYNGLHTVLTNYGDILEETPGVYMDGSNPVLMNFTTSWLNVASLQGYERLYEFYILAKYLSPHTLISKVAYDYNPSIFHQSTIRPNNFSPSVPSSFGIPVPFGSPSQLEQWRIHAKRQLCESFQLSMTEVFDPSLGTMPGGGFTMSGINCEIMIKKAARPIKGANSVG